MMDALHDRLSRARLALEGLSIGDAFGDRFFMHADVARSLILERALPTAPWAFTDDTNMALSIYRVLQQHGHVDQDALARSFAAYYDAGRGYGPAMHRLLVEIKEGGDWRSASSGLFSGMGSYGNGAAMRVAPVGAYFADDLAQVCEQAKRSAEITHSHSEGIAGAIAVAVAAAQAARLRGSEVPGRADFLDSILPYVPDSDVKRGIQRARDLRSRVVDHVIAEIGNGYRITAQDTVPYALWCAGGCLSDFEEALWLTASGLGDVDTNCAIVGGIVAPCVGSDGLPEEWLASREALPAWAVD